MTKMIQANLSGGEVSPAIAARIDFGKYRTSVAEALNFYVRPEGGMDNRGGLELVARTKSNGIVRLLPFAFSTTQTYVLEIGDLYTRFHTGGALILDSNSVKTITAITQADPAVVTSASHNLVNGQEVYITGIVGGRLPLARYRMTSLGRSSAFGAAQPRKRMSVGLVRSSPT